MYFVSVYEAPQFTGPMSVMIPESRLFVPRYIAVIIIIITICFRPRSLQNYSLPLPRPSASKCVCLRSFSARSDNFPEGIVRKTENEDESTPIRHSVFLDVEFKKNSKHCKEHIFYTNVTRTVKRIDLETNDLSLKKYEFILLDDSFYT